MQEFSNAPAIKPTATPTMKSVWNDEFEDLLNAPAEDHDLGRHLNNAEVFVQKTNRQVSPAELAEQMKAREDKLKNQPVFVDTSIPLKPRRPDLVG
ncbi:MAG: hypothetical protein QM533_03955 [Cytophagales bacterium]|nr:hypothetical protein [Cytophagales bacterium]